MSKLESPVRTPPLCKEGLTVFVCAPAGALVGVCVLTTTVIAVKVDVCPLDVITLANELVEVVKYGVVGSGDGVDVGRTTGGADVVGVFGVCDDSAGAVVFACRLAKAYTFAARCLSACSNASMAC